MWIRVRLGTRHKRNNCSTLDLSITYISCSSDHVTSFVIILSTEIKFLSHKTRDFNKHMNISCNFSFGDKLPRNNQDKSELLVFTSNFRANPELDSVVVIDESITPEPHTRNLGIILDTYLTFNNHIAKVCKVSHFHLRNISKIRKFPSKESTEILIHAFVSSKLDHCQSLLYGLPAYQLAKLQVLQNTAVRVVSLTRKYDHITPVLESLHWLPVKFRIVFKVLLLVYKALIGMAPPYLKDMLCYRSYSRSLRSASQKLLVVHRTNMKTYGDRAFSIAGPKLWNQLPLSIRYLSSVDSFKKSLKTYLFRLAYS